MPPPNQNTFNIATAAGALALENCPFEGEQLDLLIVAHNFGNVSSASPQSDTVPALASRVKQLLGIKNPGCIAFDTLFGCPGWLMGIMQANAFFKAGMAQNHWSSVQKPCPGSLIFLTATA